MSPEERLVVLESLLAKVRQKAHDRGIGLPKDLPPGVWRERIDNRKLRAESPMEDALVEVAAVDSSDAPRKVPARLTAFSETGTGNHAPLALVQGPTNVVVRGPLPTLVETDDDQPVPSAPLIEFAPAFEDEPTQNADSAEAERRMLAEIEAAEREERGPVSRMLVEAPPPVPVHAPAPPPASVIAAPPPPPPVVARISSIPAALPARTSSLPPKRTSYAPRPSIPIELEDLDDLAIPQASVPRAPGAPSLSALERAFASQPPSLPQRVDARPPSIVPPPPPVAVPAPVLAPPTPPPPAPPPTLPPPTPAPPTARPSSTLPPPPALVAPARVPTPPPLVTPPVEEAEPATVLASSSALDREEQAPESQRQKVVDARPLDDALEGVREEEQPPESGEVESQRYASHSREAMDSEPGFSQADVGVDAHLPAQSIRIDDDAPTPRPMVHDVTAEVRSLGDVDVVERPVVAAAVVATFRGAPANPRPSFGDILDQALELASLPDD